MAEDRPSIVKGKVAWKVDTGGPVPAPPREVFDAWLDGAAFADITGKPAKGSATPGAERAMWSDLSYLDEPSARMRAAAIATLDPTAQQRFTDEDMGSLEDDRWAYALEAARCGAYALRGSDLGKEAPLAAESARKALGETTEGASAVRASIRKELDSWLAS